MGILDVVGEVAGAVAAVKAVEKLDPDAGFITKSIAAVAGFKGVGAIEDYIHKENAEGAATDAADDAATENS